MAIMTYCFGYGITPPHIFEEIMKRGSRSQKKRAMNTLVLSGELRGRRQSILNIHHLPEKSLKPKKNRLVYDAGNTDILPGRLIRREGSENTLDIAAQEAYSGAGHTWDLYYDVCGRNSVNDRGMDLVSTVHYMKGYDNAFWNGDQMVYGDGDEDLPGEERLFNRFTVSLDIIGHELTHGITQYEAQLAYREQSGSLNESFSDIFGILVKQRTLKQTAVEANWLIGEGLFTANVNARALRSMKEPGTAYDDPVVGKDPQPAHMNDYVHTVSDNGGVHINSGIPNRAFCLAAIELGGYAWEKAGRIWYAALKDKLREKSDFQDAANITFRIAGELFGRGSTEQHAVYNGWEKVGITAGSTNG